MNLRELQDAAWANKKAKGFNTTDVPLEFCYLQAEVAEAFDAWRKERNAEIPGELADVAIFVVSLASILGIDLQAAVEAKLAVNAARTYRRLPNGTHVKDGAEDIERHLDLSANVTMRVCGWCESVHPEHLSISWFPDRMYFCADACYCEWAEQAGAQP